MPTVGTIEEGFGVSGTAASFLVEGARARPDCSVTRDAGGRSTFTQPRWTFVVGPILVERCKATSVHARRRSPRGRMDFQPGQNL